MMEGWGKKGSDSEDRGQEINVKEGTGNNGGKKDNDKGKMN